MNIIKDLVEAIRDGKRPVLTFKKGIDDKESYAEPGMRARAIGVSPVDGDNVIRIMFDFAEFDAHNTSFESSNYFDKNQNPTLTAREAGYYRPQDELYFDLDEKLEDLADLQGDESLALFTAYKSDSPNCSYVQWLERKLLASMTS